MAKNDENITYRKKLLVVVWANLGIVYVKYNKPCSYHAVNWNKSVPDHFLYVVLAMHDENV